MFNSVFSFAHWFENKKQYLICVLYECDNITQINNRLWKMHYDQIQFFYFKKNQEHFIKKYVYEIFNRLCWFHEYVKRYL